MQVEYDRLACGGWFQCVQKWDAFDMNMAEGKADLTDADETGDGVHVREISEELEDMAKAAAESCPVDAIKIYDDDGEQLVP